MLKRSQHRVNGTRVWETALRRGVNKKGDIWVEKRMTMETRNGREGG